MKRVSLASFPIEEEIEYKPVKLKNGIEVQVRERITTKAVWELLNRLLEMCSTEFGYYDTFITEMVFLLLCVENYTNIDVKMMDGNVTQDDIIFAYETLSNQDIFTMLLRFENVQRLRDNYLQLFNAVKTYRSSFGGFLEITDFRNNIMAHDNTELFNKLGDNDNFKFLKEILGTPENK